MYINKKQYMKLYDFIYLKSNQIKNRSCKFTANKILNYYESHEKIFALFTYAVQNGKIIGQY